MIVACRQWATGEQATYSKEYQIRQSYSLLRESLVVRPFLAIVQLGPIKPNGRLYTKSPAKGLP